MWGKRVILIVLIILSALSTTVMGVQQAAKALPEWLSAEERTRIEKERGEKERVEIMLKVSSARLLQARTRIANQEYDEARQEVKNFGTLVGYTWDFINQLPAKEKDKKKLCKIVDLSLRQNISALEAIRVEMPEAYVGDVNYVYQAVRRVRQSTLCEIFGKEFFSIEDNNQTSSENPEKGR